MPWFRVDFHNHCDTDTRDALDYSARDVVDACVERGIHAVALTPHLHVFHDPGAEAYARERGVLLLSGVEKMVSGREVVLLPVTPGEIPPRMDWDDLRALRRRRGPGLLVLAPHPYYPRESCLGTDLDTHADCFDAVEWCHFYGIGPDCNRPARTWAETHGKAVLATSDAHALFQLGRNRCEVEADALEPEALFEAIRRGRVRNDTRPYDLADYLRWGLCVVLPNELGKLRRRLRTAPAP